MTEKMPIKLDKISNWLMPRKFYVRIKENHPILGSVFLALWTGFWAILAIIVNLILIVVILGTILFILVAIFEDSSFDPVFLGINLSPSRKKEKDRR